MAANPAADFAAAVRRLYANGRGEAGLEVEADPGLSAADHVAIPECMVAPPAVLFTAAEWPAAWSTNEFHTALAAAPDAAARAAVVAPAPNTAPNREARGDTFAATATRDGWFVVDGVRMVGVDGAAEPRMEANVHGTWFAIEEVVARDPTYEQAREFYDANVASANRYMDNPNDATLHWTIATRFWNVVAGLVTTTKSREWREVPNVGAAALSAESEDFAEFCQSFAPNAWTAATARTSNWRKTNHATGGRPAVGFAKRWLQKMGYWTAAADRNQAARESLAATTAFYWATHPVSVHAVLTLMVPADEHHWAEISARYGLITAWTLHESARVRMVPHSQIAGAALVVDSLTVLESLVKEGLSPLVANIDQLGPLIAARAEVETEGMRCAVYARWFFEGHPANIRPVQFSQKDNAHANLTSELAIIATRYYANSTIGQAAALINAAQNSGDEAARTTWTAINNARRTAGGAQVQRTVARIRGASAAGAVATLADPDVDTAAGGIGLYNAAVAAHAAALHIANPPQVVEAQFRANFAAAPVAAP